MAKSRIKKNVRVRKRKKVKKRKREKAKKLLKGAGKLSLSFLIVAGLAVAGKKAEDFLLTSPHFRISEVKFEGFNSLDKKTLDNLAESELGKSIFQVNVGEIRRRLQSYPQVRKVIVSRKFPRRMEVKVEEREATAFVNSDGEIYPMDREGFIIPKNFLSRALPRITGLNRKWMKVGKRMGETKSVIALDILETFSSSGLSVSEINMEEQSPVVRIRGVKIFLGKEEGGEEKLKELKFILNDLDMRNEKAEYIDLRFSNPVVKIR